jgi:prepilin-type processing-associated H-X9-DG protein
LPGNSVAGTARLRYTSSIMRSRHAADRMPPAVPRATAGFKLLELLIVVAILLMMTAMYWNFAGRNARTSERKACAKNLQRTLIAMEIFAMDHADKFPEVPGARTSAEALDGLLPKYTVDTSAFTCPASKDSALPSGVSIARGKISYAYYMGRKKSDPVEALLSDQQVDAFAKWPGQFAFSTNGQAPGSNHGQSGGNFLFTDGRVEWSPPRVPFSLALPPGIVLLNP